MLKKEAERYELEKRKYLRGRFKELEDYREEVWHCNRCNMCKEVFGWYMVSNEFSTSAHLLLFISGKHMPPRAGCILLGL